MMVGLKRSLLAFCFHTCVTLPLAMMAGGFLQWSAGALVGTSALISHLWLLVAVAFGFGVSLVRRDRAGSLVFVLPAVMFMDSWYELYRTWSPTWSKLSRTEYVNNNLFGRSCGDTECLYAIGWGLLQPAVLYSLGALIAILILRFRTKREVEIAGFAR